MCATFQITQVQRIRGSNLAVLVPYSRNVPLLEGLRLADEKKLVVASNKRLDRALTSCEWGHENVIWGLPAWSGTMIGYEEVGKKFGSTIEDFDLHARVRYVFPVPRQYQGENNAILIVEHPYYSLEIDGKNRVVHATGVDLIRQFPNQNGWYLPDSVHGIPVGEVSPDDRAQRLYRTGKNVVNVVRYVYELGRPLVDLGCVPSNTFGVLVEQESFEKMN